MEIEQEEPGLIISKSLGTRAWHPRLAVVWAFPTKKRKGAERVPAGEEEYQPYTHTCTRVGLVGFSEGEYARDSELAIGSEYENGSDDRLQGESPLVAGKRLPERHPYN